MLGWPGGLNAGKDSCEEGARAARRQVFDAAAADSESKIAALGACKVEWRRSRWRAEGVRRGT